MQTIDTNERKSLLQEIDRRWSKEFAYAQWYFEQPFAHAYNNKLRNYSARNPLDYAVLTNTFFKA